MIRFELCGGHGAGPGIVWPGGKKDPVSVLRTGFPIAARICWCSGLRNEMY